MCVCVHWSYRCLHRCHRCRRHGCRFAIFIRCSHMFLLLLLLLLSFTFRLSLYWIIHCSSSTHRFATSSFSSIFASPHWYRPLITFHLCASESAKKCVCLCVCVVCANKTIEHYSLACLGCCYCYCCYWNCQQEVRDSETEILYNWYSRVVCV